MHTERERIHIMLLHSHIINPDFRLRNTSAVPGLRVRLILDLAVAPRWPPSHLLSPSPSPSPSLSIIAPSSYVLLAEKSIGQSQPTLKNHLKIQQDSERGIQNPARKRAMTYSKSSKTAMRYSKSSKKESDEVFKIQQESDDLFKIQQERER